MVPLRITLWLALLAATLISLAACVSRSCADDLDDVRTEVRTPRPPAAVSVASDDRTPRGATNDCQHGFSNDDDYLDSELTSSLVLGTVWIASSPIWAPIKLLQDDYSTAGYFPRYPYQQPVEGHLMLEPDLPRRPRQWFGRGWLDYGADFDDKSLLGGGLLLDTTTRFGVEATAQRWWQSRADQPDDRLWLGSTDLLFRFAQSPHFEVRTGGGFNWLADSARTDLGFNFTYRVDWYPVRPLVVSTDFDVGKLGHASLFHARVTTGLQWKRAELYVGYEYFDIGQAQLNAGISGLRFWF